MQTKSTTELPYDISFFIPLLDEEFDEAGNFGETSEELPISSLQNVLIGHH